MEVAKCWKIVKFPNFQLKWKIWKHPTRPKQWVALRKLFSPHQIKASYVFAILQNICRLFHVLAQFLFYTSEMELDYYHQKVNVRVILRVSKQQKLGNFKKIPECFDMIVTTQPTTQKPNFDTGAKISQNICCKTFHRKIYFT